MLQDKVNFNDLNWEEPLEIGDQEWNNTRLTYLGLGNRLLTTIPDNIGNLNQLEYLFLSSNQLSILPESIGNLSSLKYFFLSHNQLTILPESIGNLSNLETLYLHDNQLNLLPETICNLPQNSYIYFENNQLCPPYPECISEDDLGYQNTTNCPPLSISELSLPINYQLHQPFPNPFNPTTSISFSIPEQSQTSLKVYDIKGNLISTLLNQTMNVGHHQIEWNGENLSSGPYFIRINSGEFSDVKKVVLVK